MFNEKHFTNEIVAITDTYLRSSRGFGNVDQIVRLYSLDAGGGGKWLYEMGNT